MRTKTRIRAARLEAGLSQTELEGRSGIARTHISDIERSVVLPSLRTLDRIAAAIGCDVADLIVERSRLRKASSAVR